jgi:hypothetical protein
LDGLYFLQFVREINPGWFVFHLFRIFSARHLAEPPQSAANHEFKGSARRPTKILPGSILPRYDSRTHAV